MGSTRWRPMFPVFPGVSLGTRALQHLSVAWMMRYSTPSVTLRMTPSCVVQLARQNEGVPSRGTWTGLKSGPKETPRVSTRSSARFCTCVETIPGMREELLVRSPAGKDLEFLGDENLNRSQQCSLRGQLYPGLHQQRGGHQNEGGHCPSLVSLLLCMALF